MRRASDLRLSAVRSAFGRFASRDVVCDDPDVYIQWRRGGVATYVFLSNDHYPQRPLWQTSLIEDVPVPADIAVSLASAAVYDASLVQRVDGGGTDAGAASTFTLSFSEEEPARIWAVLPRPVGAPAVRLSSTSVSISVSVDIHDLAGKRPGSRGANRDSSPRRGRFYSIPCLAKYKYRWSLGGNVSNTCDGSRWRMGSPSEGKSRRACCAIQTIQVSPPAINGVMTLKKSTEVIFDVDHITAFLEARRKLGDELWIALDQSPTGENGSSNDPMPLSRSLQTRLFAKGIRALLMNITTGELSDVQGNILRRMPRPEPQIRIAYDLSTADQSVVEDALHGKLVGMRLRERAGDFRGTRTSEDCLRPTHLGW